MILLGEVGIRAIRDNDRFTPSIILIEVTTKVREMLSYIPNYSHPGRRGVINTFLKPVKDISGEAIKSRREDVMSSVLTLVEDIHESCADSKLSWDNMIELNEFIGEFMEDCVKAGMARVVQQGAYMIGRVMERHLKHNVPDEERVSYLVYRKYGTYKNEEKADTDSTLQWEHISRTYLEILYRTLEVAVEMKDASSASTVVYSLSHIESEVLGLDLGDMQKDDIISKCCYYLREGMRKCVEEGLHKRTFLFPVSSLTIQQMLDGNKDYAKKALKSLGFLLVMMNTRNALDKHTLNEFGTVGRGCTAKIDKSRVHKEAFAYIIRVLDALRGQLEGETDEYSNAMYVEVYSETDSLRRWLEKDGQSDPDIATLLGETLSNFKSYEERKTKLESESPEWPSFDDN